MQMQVVHIREIITSYFPVYLTKASNNPNPISILLSLTNSLNYRKEEQNNIVPYSQSS
jgi:hypothetical protein